MNEPATTPATDPNRRRRAVIRIADELIHDLLQLPPDVEVRMVANDPMRCSINVMVVSPDLPVVDEGAQPPDLTPVYDRIVDRPVLVNTGVSAIPGARQWEWAYRYVDHNAAIWHPNQTEADVRRKAAQDHSVIVLRREPGATEWEEAPA